MIRRAWEWLWAPEWAGAWGIVRVTYAIAALRTHLPRLPVATDAYGSADMVFVRGFMRVTDWHVFAATEVYAVWSAATAGLLGLLWGGRAARPGLILFLVAYWLLLGSEALNAKAYDRLLTWEALPLLLAPIGERDLTKKLRSPFPRWLMLVVFIAIYGSTGWLKLLDEPHWRDGSALAYHLVDIHFGNTALGAWISGIPSLTVGLSWFTVAFETVFPVAVLLPVLNPLVLLAGVLFHLGVGATMYVGSFSWVSLAAYPILLHPRYAERIWRAVTSRVRGFGAQRPEPEATDPT